MKIPKTFELGGRKWTVAMGECAEDGHCSRAKARIILSQDITEKEELELTFLHELFHALQYTHGDLGEHDEKFTEGVAVLAHQFIKTCKGELDAG